MVWGVLNGNSGPFLRQLCSAGGQTTIDAHCVSGQIALKMEAPSSGMVMDTDQARELARALLYAADCIRLGPIADDGDVEVGPG